MALGWLPRRWLPRGGGVSGFWRLVILRGPALTHVGAAWEEEEEEEKEQESGRTKAAGGSGPGGAGITWSSQRQVHAKDGVFVRAKPLPLERVTIAPTISR
ncbi:hypothetical protein V1478_004748 [Vespula squamosa]|uniref:Uncharacterized protein n=1 Tax=Vespula squamosa TaxID=30214 RepID=A0ABD2BHD5_VESSQ